MNSFQNVGFGLLYTTESTLTTGDWMGAGNPPGRAICRDAVGTGKNGWYVSESLHGAPHSMVGDRATLES